MKDLMAKYEALKNEKAKKLIHDLIEKGDLP